MNLVEISVACDTEMQHSGSERDRWEILVPLILDLEYFLSFSLSYSLQMCVLFICLFVYKILIVGEHSFNSLNTF